MMLTVQMMIGRVEAACRNGSVQSKYHGYTTGAHKSDAAIGHANASDNNVSGLLLSQIAVRMPMSTAPPAINSGAATCSSAANTGSLNQKLWMYVASEPIGIRPRLRNGTYRSPTTVAASAASRMRTRFQ